MWSINLDEIIDLKRMVVLAVVSVLVFLGILIGSTVNQLTWNNFRHQFALNGYAVKLDRKFVVGIEEIIRGEDAIKLLESLSPYNPKAKDGNEIVLIKLKVQNTGKWTANLGGLSKYYTAQFYPEISLYTKGSDRYGDRIESLNLDLVDQGKYRNLNMWKVFESGEIRDGLFGFEIPKGKALQKLSFGHYFSPTGEIPLDPTPITRKELSLLSLGIIYLLQILALLTTIWQRKKRTKGTYSLLLLQLIMLILVVGTLRITSLTSMKIDEFDLVFFSGYFLIISFFYLNYQKKTILQFRWISKEDMAWLINEFGKRMQWENPKISEWKGTTEIQNPSSKEVFQFKQNLVQVKHPSSDKRLVKETLLDIFAETNFDWYSFFGSIFQIHVFFIMWYFFFLR